MSSQNSSADTDLYRFFLALLIWVPLPLGSNRPWAESILEIWVFLIAIGMIRLLVYQQLFLSPLFQKIRLPLYLFGLWLLWLCVQILPLSIDLLNRIGGLLHQSYGKLGDIGWEGSFGTLSIDRAATIDSLILSVALVLIFLLTIQFSNSHQRIRTIAYVIVMSGLFQAVYGGFMTLSGMEYGFLHKKYVGQGVATGTFINRNHLAGYLEMALAIGIGLMIAELKGSHQAGHWKQRLRGWIALLFSRKVRIRLYLVMMVIALVLTHSRMGNTAFFSSMLIAGIIGLVFSRHATKSTVVLLVSLLVIDIFLVGTFFGVKKVVNRIQSTTVSIQDNEVSIEREIRDEADNYIVELAKDHKLAGTGLGSFYGAFMPYRGDDINKYFKHAHNDYLEFTAETGLVGLFLVGTMVIGSLIVALIAQAKRRDHLMRGLSFAAIMGITAILIHSMVDFNLQIPANAATFMVMMAFAWISLHYKSPKT